MNNLALVIEFDPEEDHQTAVETVERHLAHLKQLFYTDSHGQVTNVYLDPDYDEWPEATSITCKGCEIEYPKYLLDSRRLCPHCAVCGPPEEDSDDSHL